MDRGLHGSPFANAVASAWQRLLDPTRLPSARIAREMEDFCLSHSAYGAHRLEQTARHVRAEASDLVCC
jgi:hypothetical protein